MKREYSISLKTAEEIAILRDAGKVLAGIIEKLKSSLTSGITTKDIDGIAQELIQKSHVKPAFKGYRGFPGCVCVSINEEVVHGIPGERIVKEGDIVSLDVGIVYKDYYSDTAVTVGVGRLNGDLSKLLKVTEESLYKGIEQARVSNHLSDISHAIQKHVEANHFSIVREFVGHGIGKRLHEDPEIPNFGPPNNGPVLEEGMVFAIEPMVNMGSWQTKILEDGWTVVAADGKPSAHFEHCVAVTKNGPEILTK
ncbi:MAG TPA: type I methionyl aminopeptidase [Candidatus Omnitrophota bacterium]|nr:type I methionyl aminopeptidase [Candidatus Omnitrophota bacterium]